MLSFVTAHCHNERSMQARSALFDLYGDHLRSRGGRAPVAALVRLLAPLDVAAPGHVELVRSVVFDGLSAPQLRVFGSVIESVVERLTSPLR